MRSLNCVIRSSNCTALASESKLALNSVRPQKTYGPSGVYRSVDGKLKLPPVEKAPPHSISIVPGSVISGLTCSRLRRLMGPPLLSRVNSPPRAPEIGQSRSAVHAANRLERIYHKIRRMHRQRGPAYATR